jgi:hypothetical protein
VVDPAGCCECLSRALVAPVATDRRRRAALLLTPPYPPGLAPPGGETVFPDADKSARVSGPGWSDCAKQGLAHKPRKGDALLFYRCACRWPRVWRAGRMHAQQPPPLTARCTHALLPQPVVCVPLTHGACWRRCSLTPHGVEDKASLHGSCPTTKGEKWSATKCVRACGGVRTRGCAPAAS